jgi:uncharacterized membrane protein
MNKQLIAPIVALFVLLAKESYGVDIQSESVDVIVNGVLAVVALAGIFMNPKKG